MRQGPAPRTVPVPRGSFLASAPPSSPHETRYCYPEGRSFKSRVLLVASVLPRAKLGVQITPPSVSCVPHDLLRAECAAALPSTRRGAALPWVAGTYTRHTDTQATRTPSDSSARPPTIAKQDQPHTGGPGSSQALNSRDRVNKHECKLDGSSRTPHNTSTLRPNHQATDPPSLPSPALPLPCNTHSRVMQRACVCIPTAKSEHTPACRLPPPADSTTRLCPCELRGPSIRSHSHSYTTLDDQQHHNTVTSPRVRAVRAGREGR
ncbi:hypothetical protein E2C01_008004 [Portunus trituberculatus]|uniref:Uncharacterized protein n=1 Tax=Portunus trituberculatus TaxID=210409 RepID=A0A5B7D0H2_PORTR|nr:hypothetical protein [Portunus trituberculatus]